MYRVVNIITSWNTVALVNWGHLRNTHVLVKYWIFVVFIFLNCFARSQYLILILVSFLLNNHLLCFDVPLQCLIFTYIMWVFTVTTHMDFMGTFIKSGWAWSKSFSIHETTFQNTLIMLPIKTFINNFRIHNIVTSTNELWNMTSIGYRSILTFHNMHYLSKKFLVIFINFSLPIFFWLSTLILGNMRIFTSRRLPLINWLLHGQQRVYQILLLLCLNQYTCNILFTVNIILLWS